MQGNGDFHVVSNIFLIISDLKHARVEFISFLRNNLPYNVHYSLKAPESNTTLTRNILPQLRQIVMWRETKVLPRQNVTKCKVIIRLDLLAES